MIRLAMVLALAVIPVNKEYIPSTDDTFPKANAANQWAESVVTKDPFLKSTYVDGKYIWAGSTQEEFDKFNPGVIAQTLSKSTDLLKLEKQVLNDVGYWMTNFNPSVPINQTITSSTVTPGPITFAPIPAASNVIGNFPLPPTCDDEAEKLHWVEAQCYYVLKNKELEK